MIDAVGKIENGEDFSLGNYLVRTMYGLRLFNSVEKDMAGASREELVNSVVVENEYAKENIEIIKKKIFNAEKFLQGQQREEVINSINKDKKLYSRLVEETQSNNVVRKEYAGALYDNLPETTGIPKLSNKDMQQKEKNEIEYVSVLKEKPNEFEKLFGEKFKVIDNPNTNQSEKMSLMQEIVAGLEAMPDKQKAELLDRKIEFEKQKYNYSWLIDYMKEKIFNNMRTYITKWDPFYYNPENWEMDDKINMLFIEHKGYAKEQLVERKKKVCISKRDKEWFNMIRENREARHQGDIDTLKKIKPLDFADRWKYNLANSLDDLMGNVEK